MIIKLEEQGKLHIKAEKARRRMIRRYLRDVSAVLPCRPCQKRDILVELKELAFSYPQKLLTRTELEEALGTPEEIARTYIGEDAVFLLRRSTKKHYIILFSVLTLLLITLSISCILLASPMVYYSESVSVLENETESVYIPHPYVAPQLAQPRRGTKAVTCYDYRGTKLWTVTITGTFGYLYGDTSQALETDCTLTVHTDNGLTVRKENFLFANAAVVSVTTDYNGLTLQKKITLTCDRFGNLS